MAKKNEKQIQFATDKYTNKIYDAVAKAHPEPLTEEEEKA